MTAFSIATATATSLTRALSAAGVANPPLEIPSGFDWTPPVSVYQSGSAYRTDYNADDWKPATTQEIWVSTTGNDTTGNGSQSTPYRSITKALTEAAASGASGIHIRVVAGYYSLNFRWSGTPVPDKNLVVTAEGGQVVTSTAALVTWTLQASGAYRAPRTNVYNVYDTTDLDADGDPKPLTVVASEAVCAATPGSYYFDGAAVFVNTFDSRVPDNNTVRVVLTSSGGVFSVNKQWYVKGFTFDGNNPFLAQHTAVNTAQIVMEDCEFRFGAGGFGARGTGLVILVNCRAYYNRGDGFDYKYNATSLQSTTAVEIGCEGIKNGTADLAGTYNGSTAHEDCRALRVNCTYNRNVGPQIADVGTSESWNLGCSATDSTTDIPNGVTDAGVRTTDTAQAWLDGCTVESYYSLLATSPSQIRHRNCTLTGLTDGDVATY